MPNRCSTPGVTALWGLDERLKDGWPSQAEIASTTNVTRSRIGQLAGKFQSRWAKDAALNMLRSDIADILKIAGGAMTVTVPG